MPTLVRHSDTPCAAILTLNVEMMRAGTILMLFYSARGDIGALQLPPLAAQVRADELWKHTCFEIFLRDAGEAYCEFNFSPSTAWAAYSFQAYRSGMTELGVLTPHIETRTADNQFEMRVALDLSGLESRGLSRLALGAVVEDTSGAKSYWALRHPPGKPDFHHVEGFALDIPKE